MLAELKGFASSILNQHILINVITINEAKDSSAIENIVTTHDGIYKVLTESGFKDDAAKEVVDYRTAIWQANILVHLQTLIEPNKQGIRKTCGTNLANSITGEIIYAPPQTENEIRDLLKNLEDYINNFYDDTDPLIKMTLIHSKIYSDELLNSLFYEVYIRINCISDMCKISRQTAFIYLNQLVEAGLLEYEKVGRESIYKNT